MQRISPAPPALPIASIAVGVSLLLLFMVGTLGSAVRDGITDPSVTTISLWLIVLGMAGGAVVLLLASWSMVLALRANRQTRADDVLAARSSAATSRQSAFVAFGFTVAVVVMFGFLQLLFLNDGKLQQTFFQWQLMRDSAIDVVLAFGVNIKLAVISQALVLMLGLILAVARMAPGKAGAPIRFMAVAYIDIMRAVPAIIVLYLIGFGLPLTNLPIVAGLSPDWFAIIALTLTYSAYVAEIYRSGIVSIHPSQWAASRSLGFGYLQTLRWFILPQAIRLVVPPLLSAFIALQKDTSLVNVIGTLDAFNQAKFYASSSFNLSSVSVVAIVFVVLTIPQTRYVDWKLARANKRMRG
ncbi:amino acid ABC transporter permease [Agrobacterium leguminum]|uniref:Amino acid ABC transporter permease n=1 Tax=Agrobacterium leguminum TaxID=2792015 RepID=A0A9X3KGW2_9HYPH|nr:amino acid ABC transporter permease [Agrobacterium leguminum]MCZ7911491.1 amino acid ABC transporter permease [Agrobacterium leguminum]